MEYPERKHVRLPFWDYRQAGAYAVTICSADRACVFGSIREGRMELTKLGGLVEAAWREIPQHYSNVELDVHAVMPNHFHGILLILDGPILRHDADVERNFGNIQAKSRSSIIRAFKAGVTRDVGKTIWQSGFHEHIIRDEEDLWNHKLYIDNNPAQWEFDRENPDFVGP